VLQGAAACCSALQSVLTRDVLQCATVCCRVLQCATVCYSVLQGAAVCCSLLQRFALCGSV